MKLNKGEFGPEAFSLRLKNENFEVLSDVNYATHLLGRSSSVEFLHVLLEPMKKLFNGKDYGSPYNVMASQQQEQLPESAGGTATHEHGGASSPNSNNNDVDSDAAHASSGAKTEVKEDEPSTYNAMASQQQEQLPESAGGTATHEHGGANSPNSNNNDVGSDAAHASSVVKIEVKEEEPSTDDEAGLFDAIEESFVI